MRRGQVAAWGLALLSSASALADELPQPETLLRGMKAWLEPARSSTRTLHLTVRSVPGPTVEWKAGHARATVGARALALTVLLEPADVRGTALLVEQDNGRASAEWLYLPALRRVRRVLPVDECAAFLHTELSDADLGFVTLHNRALSVLGAEVTNGKAVYRLQEVPDDQRTCKRIVTWIAADTNQPLKREFYDGDDRLWKVETFEDVAVVHGTPTAQRVRVEDVQTGYGSEYRVRELAYDRPIPAELFDWRQLFKAADHPLWRSP